jgi:hypothetical protein
MLRPKTRGTRCQVLLRRSALHSSIIVQLEKIFGLVTLACDLVRGGAGAGFKPGDVEDLGATTDEDCGR